MGRKLAVDPRQIEHCCNRTHLVIVRHHLFKAERIKQLSLVLLQPTHHSPFPPLTASTPGNHCSRKPSTDFCNKIGPIAAPDAWDGTSAVGESRHSTVGRERKTASPVMAADIKMGSPSVV